MATQDKDRNTSWLFGVAAAIGVAICAVFYQATPTCACDPCNCDPCVCEANS